MDYVMPQWKRLIVDALIPLVVPQYVRQIETASCDVRFPYSISSTVNQSALLALESSDTTPLDFIVVSYLLTETRGKWKAFFQEHLELLPTHALVLLSIPTAWQLHLFLNYFPFFGQALCCPAHMWVPERLLLTFGPAGNRPFAKFFVPCFQRSIMRKAFFFQYFAKVICWK
jgi:hypothetical protein